MLAKSFLRTFYFFVAMIQLVGQNATASTISILEKDIDAISIKQECATDAFWRLAMAAPLLRSSIDYDEDYAKELRDSAGTDRKNIRNRMSILFIRVVAMLERHMNPNAPPIPDWFSAPNAAIAPDEQQEIDTYMETEEFNRKHHIPSQSEISSWIQNDNGFFLEFIEANYSQEESALLNRLMLSHGMSKSLTNANVADFLSKHE